MNRYALHRAGLNFLKRELKARHVIHIKDHRRDKDKYDVIQIKKEFLDFKYPIEEGFENMDFNSYVKVLEAFKETAEKLKLNEKRS